jgi:alpha-tubulin suppressor-like RCC1 family protein
LTFRQNIPLVATANFVENAVSISPSYSGNAAYMLMADGTIRTTGVPSALGSTSLTFTSSTGSAQATGVLAIAAGAEHVCYIKKADGSVWCAGSNSSGQVGTGVAIGATASAPVQVTFPAGTGPASAIVAGTFFTCAIAPTAGVDHVLCWGDNSFGELGANSTSGMSATPLAVVTEFFGGVTTTLTANGTALAAGADHACISGDAFDGQVGVWCWGLNSSGQLGDGTTTNRPAAVPVDFTDMDGLATVGLALGAAHSCSVGTTGIVECWGENRFGDLGNGTFTQQLVPLAIPISDATQISAGFGFTCALHRGGTVSCWGFNFQGEVGTGSSAGEILSPSLVGLSGVASISAGQASMFALMTNATIQAWGVNTFGSLGDGTEVTRLLPVPVLVQ